MHNRTHLFNCINCVLYRFIKCVTQILLYFLSKFKNNTVQHLISKYKDSPDLLNFLCLVLFNGLGGILIIFTQIKIANYIGPSKYGIFSYCIALGEIGAMFVRYGRDKSLVRELLSTDDVDTQQSLITSTFIVGLINFVIFLLIIMSCHCPLNIDLNLTSLLLVSSACIISLDFQPVYESKQMMGWHSCYNFIQKLFFIGTVWSIIIVHKPLTLLAIGLTLTISWLMVLILQFIEIRKVFGIQVFSQLQINHIIRHYKSGIYLALCSFITAAFGPLIRMMVKLMSNDTDLGIFSAGLQLYGISMFFLMQISRIGYPKLAIMARSNVNINTIRYIKKYAILMICAVSPFTILMFFFPDYIAKNIFSIEYINISTILPFLGITLFEYGIAIVLMQVLIAFRCDKIYLIGQVMGAFTIILLGIVIIPKQPLIGGVTSLLISYIIIILIYGFKLYKLSYTKE